VVIRSVAAERVFALASPLESIDPIRRHSETERRWSASSSSAVGFVDGSGWEAVYQILRRSGHAVTVVQNPTTSLADDVAVTQRALDQQPGQAVLVGHSYGGAVITEAGNHPKVAALSTSPRSLPTAANR
jgi:pimeloyl-ACP methyl ester carboxylesterase